jgi:hypothetical protein
MSDPTPRRNFFCIWARGEAFDAVSYAQSVSIEFDRVLKAGDTFNGIEQSSSGLEIELGDGTELSMDEQQEIAAELLATNRAAFDKLRSDPAGPSICLGLQETVHTDSAGSIMDLDPALMRAVLDMGIEVTMWACVSHERSIPDSV